MVFLNVIFLFILTVVFIIVMIPLVLAYRLRRSLGVKGKGRKKKDTYVSNGTPEKKEKIVGDDIGTYVDFEEIDDDK